jgi:hypothetical protein
MTWASFVLQLNALDPIQRTSGANNPNDGSVLYIFSRQKLTSHKGSQKNIIFRWIRTFMLETFYGTMVKFAHVSHEEWNVPHANKFEVGMIFDV